MKNTVAFLLLISSVSIKAQNLQEIQYAAFLKSSHSLWERSISLAESASLSDFEKAVPMYGLLNNTMATQDEKVFKEYVDETVDFLKSVIESDPENGEPRAVLSSVYGLIMAYSPMKGMLYGGKSSSLMDEAMRLSPESPLVQKLHGGSKLYTPEMFGGSPKEAVLAYERAVELFEGGDPSGNWLYLDTLVGLSMAYQKTDKKDLAIATLKKAIELEPEYRWAKSILASLQ